MARHRAHNSFRSDPTPTLSAYHYTDNAHITLLWQRTGAGVANGGSVAIGPSSNVYSAGNVVIWELDPLVVALDGEVSNSTYAVEFKKAYPERYFEMFIAPKNSAQSKVGYRRLFNTYRSTAVAKPSSSDEVVL
jgi:hypothetical protein